MYKYKKPLSEENKALLEKLAKKDFSNWNEDAIREQVIAPLVQMLGYEKDSDYEVDYEKSFKKQDMFLQAGSGGKNRLKLDYIFNIRKNNFWIIEAKKGKQKDISEDELQQAYLYSLHPKVNCRYFAVTNGWIFNLYDRNKYLKDDNADIFEPVLSINHTEYKDKFDLLYHYLGASNVLFNVKEDVLLAEIEKVMSSEVYLNRLNYFERKVSNTIKKAEREVYRNIAKLEDSADEYEQFLKSQKFQDLPNAVFAKRSIHKNLDLGCSIIKENLLDLKKYYKEDWSPLDSFIRELLPFEHIYCVNLYEPAYYYNVISLLIKFHFDKDYQGMWCKYNNKKIELSDLLEEYLYELYSFFPNKPQVRLLIYLYALSYRLAKIIVYGLEPVKAIAELNMINKEYVISEEELGKAFYSKGHELIALAEIITIQTMNISTRDIFDKNYNLSLEKAEKCLKDLGNLIEKLSKKVDYENIKKRINDDERDGMMAADDDIENPWRLIIFAVSNIIPNNYELSERCKAQLEKINEMGFNYSGNELSDEKILEHDRILNFLKYNFSKMDRIL